MATPAQVTPKWQKGNERDVVYFKGLKKIEYNQLASPVDCGCYRYYSRPQKLNARAMVDWLKYSVSLTEFRNNALFQVCNKLDVSYWTAFDSDLIPMNSNWDENRRNWEEMVEFVQEMSERHNLKLLWLAPDLHSQTRYAASKLTSNDATVFIQAATQIKKCLEISQRLSAECFLLWPYREGFDAIFLNDVAREIKLFARMLKITVEFRERLKYKCQLLIMPYCNSSSFVSGGICGVDYLNWREHELINLYMWDVTSCLYVLKIYHLENYYKLCAPPGYHMQMARACNMLGSVYISNAVDSFQIKTLTLMMKCIINEGAPPPGGINLRLTPRPDSDLRELVNTYVRYIDAIARGLRLANVSNADQVYTKQIQEEAASLRDAKLQLRMPSDRVSTPPRYMRTHLEKR